jgi:hypothetical protein
VNEGHAEPVTKARARTERARARTIRGRVQGKSDAAGNDHGTRTSATEGKQRTEAEGSAAEKLVEDIASCSLDPLRFARYAFGWGAGELAESEGPRGWQADILGVIRRHLKTRETRHSPLKIAVASGHGIGKSALVAMLIAWAISTFEDARVIITANTEPQLRTKTWPEVLKWQARAINAGWFTPGATSIKVKDERRAATWRCDMVSWNETNTEAFSGLHNAGKRIVVIFDEASSIADRVWDVTEGALTDAGTEIIWCCFGNPTLNTGRFRECFGKNKHRWVTRQIDSRTVEGTNQEQIRQWVEDYGEDSDFVRVRVRGEFPRAASQQFIPSDVVARCRKLIAEGYEGLPKVLAADVARYGDDQTVIALRQGRKAQILFKGRGLSTAETAEKLIEFMRLESPKGVVVDADGIGAGVVDHLHYRGYGRSVFEFHGGEKAMNASMYSNRRAEVWGKMRDMLAAGMQIPDDPEMEADLVGVQYGFARDQVIQLERKDDMKRRGLSSPDLADALAMTFAVSLMAPKQNAEARYVYPGAHQETAWMN